MTYAWAHTWMCTCGRGSWGKASFLLPLTKTPWRWASYFGIDNGALGFIMELLLTTYSTLFIFTFGRVGDGTHSPTNARQAFHPWATVQPLTIHGRVAGLLTAQGLWADLASVPGVRWKPDCGGGRVQKPLPEEPSTVMSFLLWSAFCDSSRISPWNLLVWVGGPPPETN